MEKEVVDTHEKIKRLEKEIKVSTYGINDTKAQQEDVEKRCNEAVKLVARSE